MPPRTCCRGCPTRCATSPRSATFWRTSVSSRWRGLHGLSHQHAAGAAAQWLGRPLAELKLVSLHLGNGASVCAIRGARSVDISMGFTPLEGFVMGNRCGDSDMRRIEQRMAAGDDDAHDAFDMFRYRVRKYIGAYHAVLNSLDGLVFTAGIGEHSAVVRETICTGLDALGITVDPARNVVGDGGIAEIGSRDAPVRVLVVPTNEELEIARATHACLHQQGIASASSSTSHP